MSEDLPCPYCCAWIDDQAVDIDGQATDLTWPHAECLRAVAAYTDEMSDRTTGAAESTSKKEHTP